MNEVEEIKSRLDVAEVIGSYITLKPAGRNLKALSPFKTERTPSFMVSPEKGIWHDFSTGEGGDVFSFVMKMEGVSFVEALEMLAKRAGVTLQHKGRSNSSAATRQKLYDAVDEAAKYYHVSLSKNKTALTYLTAERGLSVDIIRQYRLGYAPQSWDGLSKYLIKKGYNGAELKAAGLVAQKSGRDSTYDIFRGRIMFPIYDSQNRTIGFSARILSEDGASAKYINTGSTPIYNKSTAIYGFKQAKDAIRSTGYAILVEGNMDVITLAQYGVANTVAASGTALTAQQLKALSYLAEEIFICFDSDSAGVTATIRALETAAEIGLTLKVIELASGKDPDELVRKNKNDFEAAIKNAKTGADYLFALASNKFPPNQSANKKKFSDFVLPLISKMTDSIEQDHYIKKLAETLNVAESSVRTKLFEGSSGPAAAQNTEPSDEASLPISSRQTQLENALLELTLAYAATRSALSEVDSRVLTQANRPIFEALIKDPQANLEALTKSLPQAANHVKILALKGEQTYGSATEHARLLEAYTQAHHIREIQLQTAHDCLC